MIVITAIREGQHPEHGDHPVAPHEALREDGLEERLHPPVEMMAGGVDALLEVGARVHLLEGLQVVLEVVDEGVLDSGEEDGLLKDFSMVVCL